MHKNVVAALVALLSLFALPSAAQARLQCVTYARQVSEVQLSGNARDWWGHAEGRYDRGHAPKAGAVLAFAGTRSMPYGHVAVVSKVVDERHILINHANWSRPGMVERGVMAVDVSAAGDWSEVRVWYAPLGALGTTHWPVEGFIYNHKPQKFEGAGERLAVLASADGPKATYTSRIGPDFLKGIVPETSRTATRRPLVDRLALKADAKPREEDRTLAVSPNLARDPIGRIIAARVR